MTGRGFVAIGHGRKDSGVFDPGSVDGRITEHSLNTIVANVVVLALRRSGAPVDAETEMPYQTDPNYRGSVRKIRDLGSAWGAEIHHDYAGGYTGVAALYGSEQEKRIAKALVDVARYLAAVAGRNPEAAARAVYAPQHSFISQPAPPTLIVEAGRVDDPYPGGIAELVGRGEVIACGLIAGLRAEGLTSAAYRAP